MSAAYRGGRAFSAGAEDDVVPRILRGGYPEATARTRPDRRRAFFESYVTTLVSRDVLHLGAATIPFGPNLVACPVAALWETR